MTRRARLTLSIVLSLAAGAGSAAAQVFESAGSRALGMGGAFVAVASDSTATWWNPAALPTGPFVDVSIGRTTTTGGDRAPSWRERTTGVALLTPPVGLSYYRYSVADVGRRQGAGPGPASGDASGRGSDEGQDAVLRTMTVNQIGATFVQTLATGVHLGATLKYLSGRMATGVTAMGQASLSGAALRDQAADLDAGGWDAAFDMDLGAIAVAGPLRAGLVMRHAVQPEFRSGASTMVLPRQTRAGLAFDGDAVGRGPWLASMDLDLTRIETTAGERRNLAFGVERWMRNRTLAVRGGARVNTLGGHERTVTAGASVQASPGMYVEGHVALGGSLDDRGWGLGARVTF